MKSNVITAAFAEGSARTGTRSLTQYDYGQILRFSGIDLPEVYEVYFSNHPASPGRAKKQIGNSSGVSIPDEYLQSGLPVYAWLFLHTDEDDGETVYTAIIPVNRRAEATPEEPTPVQQDAITQAIAALNNAVDQTGSDVSTAQEAAASAQESADRAEEYADRAEQAADSAGYMDFSIDNNGHVIYLRTDQVAVDFALEGGHLIMEAGI